MAKTPQPKAEIATRFIAGLDAALPRDGKQSLADTEALEGLVRGFLGGIWERATRASQPDATFTIEEAAAEDVVQARAFMAVVAGEDDAWLPAPEWTPGSGRGGLNDYLRATLDEVCSPKMLGKPNGGVEGLATYLIGTTYRQLQTLSVTTEDDAKMALDTLVAETVHMLMGVPVMDEDKLVAAKS